MKARMLRQFLLISLALLVALVGSAGAAPPPPGNGEPPGIARAIEVQEEHTPRLMATPLVVGTGVGLTDDGHARVVVFTTRPGAAVPRELDGVPVEVQVTGMFVAREDSGPTDRWTRPVPIGVSTGHPDITAGTIGARVKDVSGNVYALSNNHVYADCNDAKLGDNVLQPGTYDGGTDPEDKIGTLYDYEPILFDGSHNTIDAAIAWSSTDLVGFSTPTTAGDGYGTPSKITTTAYEGLDVQKCGRTTGCTDGTVAELNVTVDVCYETAGPFRCKKLARFVDQFTVTPGTFSAGGDSGSLIVTKDESNSPVGLLFAGSDTRTIANPIDAVLSRFDVTIDDGSGGDANDSPVASFTYTTSDLTATFTDTSTDSDGRIAGWSWDFGDDATSTAQNPSHTYAADGTYTVSLTVTDDDGATDTASQNVTVSSDTNSPPTADFSYTTTDLTADFTDQSSDSDGTISTWSWDFGDGATSTDQNPSHAYSAGGTYTVNLTVTDNDGATDTANQSVTVSSGSGGGISLSAVGYKVRGRHHIDLTWSGATSTNVDVYRNGSLITTTDNDGAYTDATNNVGGGSYTYQVCEAGTTTCSNEVTVTF